MTNIVRQDTAIAMGAKISPVTQRVKMADNISQLKVVGELHESVHHGKYKFQLFALVVSDLDVEVLAGVPFKTKNGIHTREEFQRVYFHDGNYYCYTEDVNVKRQHVHKAQALKVTTSQTLWPYEYIELPLERGYKLETPLLIEGNDSRINWVITQITESVESET